jgi:tetratricopeptide (TPR) repeat protein
MTSGRPFFLATARGRWLVAAILAAGTFLLYLQVGGFPFVYFDDNRYLSGNPVVRAGLTWDGVAWAFSTFHVSNWHPLTWLSHMLDVELFGLDAGAHHLVNAALHAVNAGLLLLVLARMTGATWRSAFVAALFAVHPLHVESVAWVAERKDVLSTLFGFLALWAYGAYARRLSVLRYLLVVLAFAASLMAKPMWVTFPFLLLLLDAWPLQRLEGSPLETDPSTPVLRRLALRRLLLEKVPLLLLSAASSAVTVLAQERAVAGLDLGLGARLGNAAVAYATYLWKCFWPDPLAVFYPHPKDSLPAWQVAGAVAILVAITSVAVRWIRRLPWLAVGWFWFLGTLVPVIGLLQVGSQAMADRYTYLPIIGVFVAVAWGAERLVARWRIPRAVGGAAAVAALAALSAVAWRQIGTWSNHEVLFGHAIAVTPPNGQAHGILSQGLRSQGKLDKALYHAREAVRLEPTSARHWQNLGFSLIDLRLYPEAREALLRAVQLRPEFGIAWANLGQVELELGNLPGAVAALEEARRLAPTEPQVWYGASMVELAQGRVEEAKRALGEAIRLKPDHAAAWTQLAVLQERTGRPAEAAQAFRGAVVANPEDPVVWRNLGVFSAKYGQPEDAVQAFGQALRRRPGDPDVLYRLGLVLLAQGRSAEALEVAARLEPADPARAADLRGRAGAGR